MSCRNCRYVKEPRRLGYDKIVGEEWECHFGAFVRKVKPDDSCCFATDDADLCGRLAKGDPDSI